MKHLTPRTVAYRFLLILSGLAVFAVLVAMLVVVPVPLALRYNSPDIIMFIPPGF